jgi:hypothetical protein
MRIADRAINVMAQLQNRGIGERSYQELTPIDLGAPPPGG